MRAKLLFVLWLLLSGCQNTADAPQNAMLYDEKVRQKLETYLTELRKYRDLNFQEEILMGLSKQDTTLVKNLEQRLATIKESRQMDSLWLSFSKEPNFQHQKAPKNANRYRLILFTELSRLIEIYRIEKTETSPELVYKKIRLVCESPIISGKPLEKSCFQLMASFRKTIPIEKMISVEKMVYETEFWELPALNYSRSCMDGPSWKLEIVEDDRYRQMNSYCPGMYNPVYLIGKEIQGLAGK